MTTVNELLPYMLIIVPVIVSVISCWQFLGGSLRSSSPIYWRSIRSRFRDENQGRTRRGAVFAGWLHADNKETDGPLSILLACFFVLKKIQRVNAQELTEKASTQETFADVSRLATEGEPVVFTPLAGEKRALPTLLNPMTAVLLHLTSLKNSFEVIVARSSTARDEHLSWKIEVCDSVTSEWTEACDVPRPVFALNEHQGGVFVNGTVLSTAFLESGGRGVMAFDGKWVTCAIPDSCSCNTLQVVESNGKMYVFSDRERGAISEHCIDELEFSTDTTWRWKNVIRMKRSDARSLLVYPEQTCVGFRDGKLCSFNDRSGDGVVYDTRIGELLVKTSGHCDSRAADYAKQVLFKFVRVLKGAGAMGIFQKTLLAMAVGCFTCLPQRANAQQLTGNGNPVDVAAWLTSDLGKGALLTLFAGGLGAAFMWKRFICSPPTFTVANISAALEASPRVIREDLDSIYPLIDDWALASS